MLLLPITAISEVEIASNNTMFVTNWMKTDDWSTAQTGLISLLLSSSP
jgi:hypothetical protein